MNPRIYILMLIALTWIGVGCKPKQTVATPPTPDPKPVSVCGPILQGVAPYHDLLSEVGTNLEGDCLYLKYTYGGGCKEHDVELYWAGTWTETIPPGTKVWISHNANEDACKALKSDKKAFDLKPLRYDGVGQVVIDVIIEEGKMQRVNYVYPLK